MAIKKQVKEYSGRQRINLNKADGFNTNDDVYILTGAELKEYKDTIFDLNQQLQSSKNEKDTAIETAQKLNESIIQELNKRHEKELSNREKQIADKDDIINELNYQLDGVKAIVSNFLIKLNGLNWFEMIIRHKHKDLIDDIKQSVWIVSPEVEIIENTDDSSNSAIAGNDSD